MNRSRKRILEDKVAERTMKPNAAEETQWLFKRGWRRLVDLLIQFGFVRRPTPNLEGDREMEWSWVAAHLGKGPGTVLDFGCGPSNFLSLTAAHLGYQVTAVDQGAIRWAHVHPALRFLQGDILQLNLESAVFDVIINCSSIEHVGLPGRYGSADRPDGDLEAMAMLRDLLTSSGIMVMTIPVGRDAVFAPFHRVYGKGRLPRLLKGWSVDRKEFWTKDGSNRWVQTEESQALDQEGSESCYGLGLFVLHREPDGVSPS